jgi:hypothetical protein
MRNLVLPRARLVLALVAVAVGAAPVAGDEGRVVDRATAKPIAGAVVTVGDDIATTDALGGFRVRGDGEVLRVRAVGYRRAAVPAAARGASPLEIALEPFRPKALYLSFYGIGSRPLREQALELVERTELNALVIDVKGDNGKIPYRSAVALASGVGAQGPTTIPDVEELMRSLRERGIYTVARIVVFKDLPLASARPELAVKTAGGAVWRDRERLAWTDPFRDEVRDYNVAIAVEAARHGFDEVQFDYVRFPDTKGLVYARPSTRQSRIAAIDDFLVAARAQLASYNVFLSADIFGYVCWNVDDTAIGQRIEELAPLVDYLSPMLYPSSFQFGIPGYRHPVAHPYEIVRLSLERGRARTGLDPLRFRPWLQAFKDYAFDRRPFGAEEIRAQIAAAEDFGAGGWMLWNPHNVYPAAGLRE